MRFTWQQAKDHEARVFAGKYGTKHENNFIPNSGLCAAEHCQQADALEGGDSRKAQGGKCPLVRFTIRRKKLLDVDAKYAAVKHLLDGVVATGIVAGDKEGEITLEVIQIKTIKGENPSTVIEVSEL